MRWILALLVAGCTGPAERSPTSEESKAIGQAIVTFSRYRVRPVCDQLVNLRIVEDTHEAVQEGCRIPAHADYEVLSCMVERSEYLGGPTYAQVWISDAVREEDRRLRLLIHESLHMLRACWVSDDQGVRFNEGCDGSAHRADDPYHCDWPLWVWIERITWDTYRATSTP